MTDNERNQFSDLPVAVPLRRPRGVQIEGTPTSLSEHVNALADTVNPSHAAKRKAASARSAGLGAKDKVMGAASQAVSKMTSAAGERAPTAEEEGSAAPDRLRRQVTANPPAAGLIAAGAGRLAGSILPATSAEERPAAAVKDAAVPAVTGAAKDAAASLQPSAKHAAESVKATAAAAAAVKDESARSAHDLGNQAQIARGAITGSRS